MKKIPRFPLVVRWPLFPAAALLLARALPLPAATLSYHRVPPKPGSNDVTNFTGATRDRDNIGGDGRTDGDANDASTYVAGVDRPHQGQTFTTGSNPAGYQVNAVWLRHAGYSSNADATWWCAPADSALTVRVTRPAAAGTFAFALATEPVAAEGTEPGAPNAFSPLSTRVNSPNGTGLWLRFAFASPVMLYPNTQYGFDLTAHTPEFFFETLGLRDDTAAGDAYPGGGAYRGTTTGRADNSLNPLAGDRVFVVELAPAIDVARNGEDVFLAWPRLAGPIRHVEIHRNESSEVAGRVRVASITGPANSHVERVPDAKAAYWYWLIVTHADGGTETIGPVSARSAEVWMP